MHFWRGVPPGQRGQKGLDETAHAFPIFVLRVSASAREMAEISLIRTIGRPGFAFDRAKTSL